MTDPTPLSRRSDSAMEEWARRRLIEEDVRSDERKRRWEAERAERLRFRERHPILYRLWYGRG